MKLIIKAFNGLHNLNWLDLSNNQIVSIVASCFDEVKSLVALDLENNNIKDIEPMMLRNLTKTNEFKTSKQSFSQQASFKLYYKFDRKQYCTSYSNKN